MRPVPCVRVARTALVVPALVLALSACGGAATRDAGADTSSSAPPSASGSDPAGTSGSEGRWDEQTLVPAMRAAMQEQQTVHFSMTTSGGGGALDAEGELAFDGASQGMAMTMAGDAMGTGDVEMRLVDKVVFLSMPPMTPKGKFVEIRPGDESSPFAGMVGQLKSLDPRDTFTAFESGLRKVTYVGEESVHGEDLGHYRLTVDFRTVAKAQGLPHMVGMPRAVTYDTWLDDAARMRRFELHMQQSSVVMEMFDWGEPVTIEAPPRKDVVAAPRR